VLVEPGTTRRRFAAMTAPSPSTGDAPSLAGELAEALRVAHGSVHPPTMNIPRENCALCDVLDRYDESLAGAPLLVEQRTLVSAMAKLLRARMADCAHCAEIEGYCGACYETNALLETIPPAAGGKGGQ
jgi:hypothetical protein